MKNIERGKVSVGKALLAILIIWILNFFLGYLIFGLALSNFYESNSVHYPGLVRDNPIMSAIFLSTLLQSILIVFTVYILGRAHSFGRGFAISLVVFLLYIGATDFFIFATMNLYNGGLIFIDILISSLLGGIYGGIVGWFVNRKKEPKPEKTEPVRPASTV